MENPPTLGAPASFFHNNPFEASRKSCVSKAFWLFYEKIPDSLKNNTNA